jgi:transcription termination factor Rho
MADGYGFLRKDNYLQGTKDIYVPPQYIRRFNLKTGDYITGPGKLQRENDRYQALLYVKDVNGMLRIRCFAGRSLTDLLRYIRMSVIDWKPPEMNYQQE